jgi:hypothetical protein
MRTRGTVGGTRPPSRFFRGCIGVAITQVRIGPATDGSEIHAHADHA